jgi:hypothetical protein
MSGPDELWITDQIAWAEPQSFPTVRYIRADLCEAALKDAERWLGLLREARDCVAEIVERRHRELGDQLMRRQQPDIDLLVAIDAAIASQMGVAKENGPET